MQSAQKQAAQSRKIHTSQSQRANVAPRQRVVAFKLGGQEPVGTNIEDNDVIKEESIVIHWE